MTAANLRSLKVGMFSERETLEEAMQYALSLVPKDEGAFISTGIMVYQNTLLEVLAKQLEEEK